VTRGDQYKQAKGQLGHATRLRPEIKERWLAALRSGEYKQARGRLGQFRKATSETSHCCLGVLCELAVQDRVIDRVLISGDINHDAFMYHATLGDLPWKVVEWAFSDDPSPTASDPRVPFGNGFMRLSGLNDMERLSFNQIADIIEENL
jgi:hypothetical protein